MTNKQWQNNTLPPAGGAGAATPPAAPGTDAPAQP